MTVATHTFPIDAVRAEFPSLAIEDDGRARIYLDNPAGTQVPSAAGQAAMDCLLQTNANLGGAFATSRQAGAIVENAHAAMADLLGAQDPKEITIGQSMTALTFALSRSIAKTIAPGDEVIVTRMDHDGNIAPWLRMAEDCGAVVRWLDFDRTSWAIEPEALRAMLSTRTRLVALTAASNLTGSINDVATLSGIAHAAGALLFVDAVQYTPHVFTDVTALGCDFLACSSYKFFGPHLGILWGREELLRSLEPYKVRPASDDLPDRWETGTSQIELQAALGATVEYYARLGTLLGSAGTRRERIRLAFAATVAWEERLAAHLIEGLRGIDDVSIVGISEPARFAWRVPTVSFRHARIKPSEIARALGKRNIFVWSGHNYALELVRSLGIPENEGVVRIGMAHYNTPAEIELTLQAIREILMSR